MSESKLDSPSFHRNVEPITTLLAKLFADRTLSVLEIGSGSGQHIAHFGKMFPLCSFQPTDIEAEKLASIDSWVSEENLQNVRPATQLDVTQEPWPFEGTKRFDVFTAFNVIHIAPWEVTETLFQGAGKQAKENARILLYGPFKMNGEHTSESNMKFEQWLKEKDQAFGVRDLGDIEKVANTSGFTLANKHEMPANNFMMEFMRVD